MDVRIEATAITVTVSLASAVVKAVTKVYFKALSQIESVASFSCPSLGGTSLSAVSPDHTLMKGTAVAV